MPAAHTGSYASSGPPYGLGVEFGSPVVFGPSFGEVEVGIGNDFGGADFYTVVAPLIVSADGLGASLELVDLDGDAFVDDRLPAGAAPIDAFELRRFTIAGVWVDGNGGQTQIEIVGTVDSLRCTAGCAVPEPGSLALLGIGLAAWRRGARRSAAASRDIRRRNDHVPSH